MEEGVVVPTNGNTQHISLFTSFPDVDDLWESVGLA